jgi:hypothetical protein
MDRQARRLRWDVRPYDSIAQNVLERSRTPLAASGYFKPRFFPAINPASDSRIRLSRVSGRLVSVNPNDEVTAAPW